MRPLPLMVGCAICDTIITNSPTGGLILLKYKYIWHIGALQIPRILLNDILAKDVV